MEFQFLFNFIASFFFLATVLTLFKQWKGSQNYRIQKLPPGPRKLPFIGNLHQLMGSLPHYSLRDLAKKYGSLMSLQLGEFPTIVVSSSTMAKEVLKTHDLLFTDRPKLLVGKILFYNYTDMGFSPYGDYWKQMRKICFHDVFSAKSVRSLVSIREDEVSRLIADIRSSAGESINLTEKIFSCTNTIVCREVFGRACKNQEELIGAVREVIIAAGGFNIADLFPSYKFLHAFSGLGSKLAKIHQKMDRMLEDMINEHVENRSRTNLGNGEFGQDDLVDVLLKIKETDDVQFPITSNYMKAILLDIFVAGTDSTSVTLDWAMAELIKNPAKMDKVQREVREALNGKKKIDENDVQGLNYLKLVIKETLRLHPPGPLLSPKECKEDCEIGGYNISTGTKVFFNAWAIARDPENWQDPDSFEPERFENSPVDFRGSHFELIPFGAGKRMCPGVLLAVAHIELPLALLLYHFNWKLPDDINIKDFDMEEAPGSGGARKQKLHLIPTSYDPSTDMSF